MTTAAGTSSTAMAVFVCSKKGVGEATPNDLYEMPKRNIRIGDILYTCSHVKELPQNPKTPKPQNPIDIDNI